MGGGEHKEHLLFTLPFSEPPNILPNLRKKYPAYSFTWHQIDDHGPYISSSSSSTTSNNDPELAHLFKTSTILITLGTFPSSTTDAPHLKWIQLFSASANRAAETPIFRNSDHLILTTVSGIHGPQIAEWVVMSTLVTNHRYNLLRELQKQHRWGKTGFDHAFSSIDDLVGQRLGVLGYGSIGRQVARVAHAMGMSVFAYTATPKETPEARRDRGFIVPGTGDAEGKIPEAWFSGLEREKLREFLAQELDVVVASVPLTKETEGMLGEREFEVLGKTGKPPLIVNIARGKIVDTDALIKALKNGDVRGAALDVTDPEPLPKDSELWDMENVIVTPHISGSGRAYTDRAIGLLEENLRRLEKGEKLLNVVQKDRGY